MSARLPHLLEPYLALPPETSLILLTSVLGASSNWLTLRYLYSYLKSSSSHPSSSSSSNENITAVSGGTGVVLVSFMRDGTFWRDGAGRMGLDLDAAARSNRFVFVDGLTELFSGDQAKNPGMGSSSGRLGDGNPRVERILRSSRLADVQAGINAALAQLQTSRKILVIDQIDALLAASEEDVTSAAVSSMLLSLRESVHATVLTMSADDPLLHSQTTTLEREHASLVLGQAHAADRVLALRMLDTGTAKDVSGVVRITRGGGGGGAGAEDEEEDEGKEYLYHVTGDGGVRVFERGT